MLFISYDKPIVPAETEGFKWHAGYAHLLDGPMIVDFVDAVGRYSGYDTSVIKYEIKRKTAWYIKNKPKSR